MCYQPPRTRFRAFLERFGENITLYPIVKADEAVSYGENINIKAVTSAKLPEEVIIEPGYTRNDFLTLYTFIPIRTHDKIQRQSIEYEVGPVQLFRFKGEPDHYRAVCRRFLA